MSQQSLARECAQTTPGGQGGDQALPHGMQVQLSENWRDSRCIAKCPSPTKHSGLTGDGASGINGIN